MKKIFTKEVVIGLCVVVALAILFFGINFLKGVNVFKATNYYYATYGNVDGLSVSAPVTLNGFKVGQVRDITYDYDHPGHVMVEISLDKELKLPLGTKAVLGSDLLGTASIQLVLGESNSYQNVGDNLQGVNASGLMDAVSNQLMPAVAQIFPKIDTLLTTVNMLASDPALKNAVQRLDGITADLQATTSSIALMAKSLEPLPGQLSPILSDASVITGNFKSMSGNLDVMSQDMTSLSGRLRDMPVDSLLNNLQQTTDNLRMLTQQLNDPNSSLGLLMQDPALYNNLNSTVSSLDSLFVDIKKNPKRYINVKIF